MARAEQPTVAPPPSELRRVRVLLAIDTLSDLGKSVRIDGARMESVFREGFPRTRLELTTFYGDKVSRNNILAHYRDLDADPSEALVFYYAGHGATDLVKGHYLALNYRGEDEPRDPLLRTDLKQAMLQHRPGLMVIITDCCSNVHRLPKRPPSPDAELAPKRPTVSPVLRDLLLRHRGVVDVTASTGNASFGDDEAGGIFTRTLGRLLESSFPQLDTNHDGFLEWSEFFPLLQQETEHTFSTWAKAQRALGDDIEQKSQRPRALALPGAPVLVFNPAVSTVRYEYRWQGTDSWRSASLAAKQSARLRIPPSLKGQDVQLEVRSEGASSRARPGESVRLPR
jgi:hypothetical protein